MLKKSILIVFAAMMITGCQSRIGDFTTVSTKNIDINQNNFVIGKRHSGKDIAPIILIPIMAPNIKDAIDHTIEVDQCAVGLSDAVLYEGFFSFIFGAMWYSVEGNLIIDKTRPGCENWTATLVN